MMTGILLLLPSRTVPDGAWLLLAGAILIAASIIRYMAHLQVSAFIVALGLLAVAAGVSTFAGVDLPLLAGFLVLLGGAIVIRPWLSHSKA